MALLLDVKPPPPLTSIPKAPLRALVEDERFRRLDRMEAYFRKTQDDAKKYDWDGMVSSYGSEAAIQPGWYVPHKLRRPSSRRDLARLIVNRLSSMMFGQDRFPDVRIEGDEDAEDYVTCLAKESRLATRIREARDLGGATGTACLSFGFVNGKPRIKVHNSKHVTVLDWEDEDEFRPAAVMEAFSYTKKVYNAELKKMEVKTFWRVRFWDALVEVTWRDIPDSVAALLEWQEWPKRKVNAHGYGFCPFYWIQNRPCSSEYEGEGDYEGCESTFDDINRLVSSITKGTISNVDPTLVVKMDPASNTGDVRKGSDNAIFSPGGAEYLELKGTAVQAAKVQCDDLVQGVLDECGVILPDPEKLAGSAQSAQALRILYQPMLANCDIMREQYGDMGIKVILRDMLEVARMLLAREPTQLEDGTQVQAVVILPPRVEREEPEEPGGEPVVTVSERVPGESSEITLNWPPYFTATWKDIKEAAEGMKNANGGKATLSQRTTVKVMGSLVGVDDWETELAIIKEEETAAIEQQQEQFESQLGAEAAFAPPPKPPAK